MRAFFLVPIVAAGLGCSEPATDEAARIDDVSDEKEPATEKPPAAPPYSLETPEIAGTYVDSMSPDRTVATVSKVDADLVIRIDWLDVTAKLTSSPDGKVTFDTGELEEDWCDNPGCSVLVSVKGAIAPELVDGAWVPTLRYTEVRNYPYPEYEGDNEGHVAWETEAVKAAEIKTPAEAAE